MDGKLLKWEDLQGFWDMIKEELFTELELIRQNGWKELCMHVSIYQYKITGRGRCGHRQNGWKELCMHVLSSYQYKITGGAVSSCIYNYLCNQCLSPLKYKYFVFLNM